MLALIIDWSKHLKAKGFSTQDPFFPRSKIEQGKDNLAFESASEVEPVFWHGAGRIREIFKKRSLIMLSKQHGYKKKGGQAGEVNCVSP
jgi:hypothetical protein